METITYASGSLFFPFRCRPCQTEKSVLKSLFSHYSESKETFREIFVNDKNIVPQEHSA